MKNKYVSSQSRLFSPHFGVFNWNVPPIRRWGGVFQNLKKRSALFAGH